MPVLIYRTSAAALSKITANVGRLRILLIVIVSWGLVIVIVSAIVIRRVVVLLLQACFWRLVDNATLAQGQLRALIILFAPRLPALP